MDTNKLLNEIGTIIKKIDKELSDLSGIMPIIVGIINNAIDRNMDANGQYDSQSENINIFSGGSTHWAELSNSTLQNYERKGYELKPTLYRTGQLRRQTEVRSKGNSITISSNAPYAAIHQYGGWVNIPAHTRTIRIKTSKLKEGDKRYGFDTNGVKKRFAKAKAKGKNVTEKTVRVQGYKFYVPARPFIVLNEKDMKEIKSVLLKYYKLIQNGTI